MSDEGVDNLFEVNDDRVRVECEVSYGDQSFLASAMCDGGASKAELTLPPRKIIQLGLEPFGQSISKGSTNDTTVTIRFRPPVAVKMKFLRGEEELEERTEFLIVSCHKNEYEQELLNSSASNANTEITNTASASLSGVKRKASDLSESSGPKIGGKLVVKLSPVAHRPPNRPNERVVLGQAGLKKFKVHANFAEHVLEIEEEDEFEYEE
jgi:hypothetical protein